MSNITDLVLLGAIGFGAYYLYNTNTQFKAGADTTIETVKAPLKIKNPDPAVAKEGLKESNKKVVEEINEAFDTDLPTTPEPVVDLLVDLKGGSVLPNAGVPFVVNTLKGALGGVLDFFNVK